MNRSESVAVNSFDVYRGNGFTLIELVLVLGLFAIAATVAITGTLGTFDEDGFEDTRIEMVAIRNAMVGDPSVLTRNVRSDFGYQGDVGSLPVAIGDLLTQPAAVTQAYTVDSTNRVGHGWNGPYVTETIAGEDITTDAWGNAYVWNRTATPPTLVSLGADGAAGGSGLDSDITLQIPVNMQTATVNGFIVNGGAGNPNDEAATITVYYPNGTTGALASSVDNIIVGDNGYFSIANVPQGIRSATIVIGADTYGPFIFNVNGNNYTVPVALTDKSAGGCPESIDFNSPTGSGMENIASHDVVVELSAVCAMDVFVDYATANGTANAGADYTSASGTITILAGQTSVNLSLAMLDDGTVESGETFTVTLSNATLVNLGTNSVLTFEIVDDENPPIPAITDLLISNIGINELDLSWTQAAATPAVTDFVIEYKKSSEITYSVFADGVNTNTSITVNGLDEDTEYNFRVKALNGSTGPYSNVETGTTAPNLSFFDPTLSSAFNLGGATDSQIVAMEDGAVITLTNATFPTGTTLHTFVNAGETHSYASAFKDQLSSDKQFFVAGRKGSGGNTSKGNIVWNPPSWAGTEFFFTGTRTGPHIVSVYAFVNATVSITQGGLPVDSKGITAGMSDTFSVGDGSYEMTSTGLIIAYVYSEGAAANSVVDPYPIIPSSSSILGIPSTSSRIATTVDANNFNRWDSAGATASGTFTLGATATINGTGTTGNYRARPLRIIADNPIVGLSRADGNGNCVAPFVPTALLKKKFAINVNAGWVTFASIVPTTITRTNPGGGTSTITLTRTGTGNSPYGARITGVTAGTRFEAATAYQAWYEPNSDSGGATLDETIMYGFD